MQLKDANTIVSEPSLILYSLAGNYHNVKHTIRIKTISKSCFSVCLLQLDDFNLASLVLKRFCSDPDSILDPASTGGAIWCHVLPRYDSSTWWTQHRQHQNNHSLCDFSAKYDHLNKETLMKHAQHQLGSVDEGDCNIYGFSNTQIFPFLCIKQWDTPLSRMKETKLMLFYLKMTCTLDH